MKKVKFMLMSLALVAVVGGALAFKAKSANHFCSTLAHIVAGNPTCKDPNILTCPNPTAGVTIGGNSGDFYCTTPDNNQDCAAVKPNCLDVAPEQTFVQD